MSKQGFRQIFKWDDPNLKELNDMLRWLYGKVTGRVEMRDLSTETKTTIDSKADGAVVGEIKETADQAKEEANAAVGAVVDMQGDVEQAKQDSAQAKADSSEALSKADEATTKVVSMQTSIEQNKEAIRLKADKTVVDELSGTVTEHSAQFEVTAEQISQKVSKETFDELGNRVTAAEGSITTQAGLIEANASSIKTAQDTADGAVTQITNANLRIDGLEGEISQKVSKETFDELGNRVTAAEGSITTQAGAISANAQKIETVQSTADAAQTQANANKTNLSEVTTWVTTAEQTISALDGKIAAKVEKTEFDALGNEVSRQGTLIEQTAEDVLIQAGRTVGGTNYLKDSARSVSNSTYNIANYYFSDGLKPKAGETMTVRIWGTLGEGKTGFAIYNTNGYNSLGSLTDNGDGTFSAAFKWSLSGAFPDYAVTEQSQTHIQVYAQPKTVTGVASTITKIKLEKGDYATDWTSHPEEFQAGSSVKITEDEVNVSTKKFGVNIVGEDGVTNVLTIDEEGAVFQSAEAPNIAPRYDGPATLYVDPNATSAQIAAGNYYRSLADVAAVLRSKWIDRAVTVNLAAGMEEYTDVILRGIGGGRWVEFVGDSNNHAKVTGSVQMVNYSSPITFKYIDVVTTKSPAVLIDACQYVALENCTIAGAGAANSKGVEAKHGANVGIGTVSIYGYRYPMYSDAGANIAAYGCTIDNYVFARRATIYISSSKLTLNAEWTPEEYAYAGQVLSADIETNYEAPAAPTPSEPTTTAFSYIHSDSYCAEWGYKDTEDVWQGYVEYVDGKYAAVYGVIWFDTAAIQSTIGTKTVKQASLRLHMHTGVGRGAAVSVQLYGTNTAYDGRSGAPDISGHSYGTIIDKAIPGEINEITIPAAVINDIVSGTIQALVLKSDDTALHKDRNYSKNYARFSGTTTATSETCPRLTVVYQ